MNIKIRGRLVQLLWDWSWAWDNGAWPTDYSRSIFDWWRFGPVEIRVFSPGDRT